MNVCSSFGFFQMKCESVTLYLSYVCNFDVSWSHLPSLSFCLLWNKECSLQRNTKLHFAWKRNKLNWMTGADAKKGTHTPCATDRQPNHNNASQTNQVGDDNDRYSVQLCANEPSYTKLNLWCKFVVCIPKTATNFHNHFSCNFCCRNW